MCIDFDFRLAEDCKRIDEIDPNTVETSVTSGRKSAITVSSMVKLNAHFDGKVIVPDEPLALKPNQRIRVSIEAIEPSDEPPKRVDLSKLRGLGKSEGPPHDPGADEDALWENRPLPPAIRDDK